MNNDMNTRTQNGCLLLFRGMDWHKGLSPEEMQQIATQWMAWFERLSAAGKAIGGKPLEREGRVVIGGGKRQTVSDGPFAETKEAVAGFFLLKVDTLEEAVEIAKECPGLPYGAVVEVRPVAEECTVRSEARRELETLQTA